MFANTYYANGCPNNSMIDFGAGYNQGPNGYQQNYGCDPNTQYVDPYQERMMNLQRQVERVQQIENYGHNLCQQMMQQQNYYDPYQYNYQQQYGYDPYQQQMMQQQYADPYQQYGYNQQQQYVDPYQYNYQQQMMMQQQNYYDPYQYNYQQQQYGYNPYQQYGYNQYNYYQQQNSYSNQYYNSYYGQQQKPLVDEKTLLEVYKYIDKAAGVKEEEIKMPTPEEQMAQYQKYLEEKEQDEIIRISMAPEWVDWDSINRANKINARLEQVHNETKGMSFAESLGYIEDRIVEQKLANIKEQQFDNYYDHNAFQELLGNPQLKADQELMTHGINPNEYYRSMFNIEPYDDGIGTISREERMELEKQNNNKNNNTVDPWEINGLGLESGNGYKRGYDPLTNSYVADAEVEFDSNGAPKLNSKTEEYIRRKLKFMEDASKPRN